MKYNPSKATELLSCNILYVGLPFKMSQKLISSRCCDKDADRDVTGSVTSLVSCPFLGVVQSASSDLHLPFG